MDKTEKVFEVVGEDEYGTLREYVHTKTGVHYLRYDAYSCGGLCVMLNPDGTPYTTETKFNFVD